MLRSNSCSKSRLIIGTYRFCGKRNSSSKLNTDLLNKDWILRLFARFTRNLAKPMMLNRITKAITFLLDFGSLLIRNLPNARVSYSVNLGTFNRSSISHFATFLIPASFILVIYLLISFISVIYLLILIFIL